MIDFFLNTLKNDSLYARKKPVIEHLGQGAWFRESYRGVCCYAEQFGMRR